MVSQFAMSGGGGESLKRYVFFKKKLHQMTGLCVWDMGRREIEGERARGLLTLRMQRSEVLRRTSRRTRMML